jgi:hypothetical protein
MTDASHSVLDLLEISFDKVKAESSEVEVTCEGNEPSGVSVSDR